MAGLAGKCILAFGDSIVDGHLYKKAGFLEFVAEQEGMRLIKYANNGACVMPGNPVGADGLGGMILEDQILRAAKAGITPDYVVFDGGTNDAYEPILKNLGSGEDAETEATFAGVFRKTILAIKENWPAATIVYVAVHRLGYRSRAVQEALHRIEMNICAQMGVAAADLYDECALDTSDEAMCRRYSFDIMKDGVPAPGERPTGTHPNFEAIREFYLPFVSETLRRAERFRFREISWDAHEEELLLYWELPEHSRRGDVVEVWLDGERMGSAEKNEFAVTGLKEDTAYEIVLRAVRGRAADEGRASEGACLQTARVYCRTKKRKQRSGVIQESCRVEEKGFRQP